MKTTLFTLLLLCVTFSGFAGDFMRELENSLRCRECPVQYVLHMPDGSEQVFSGSDFTSGDIVQMSGVPHFLELYHGAGTKKHNIMINISKAVWYRFNIEKVDGNWSYDFHFYYQ